MLLLLQKCLYASSLLLAQDCKIHIVHCKIAKSRVKSKKRTPGQPWVSIKDKKKKKTNVHSKWLYNLLLTPPQSRIIRGFGGGGASVNTKKGFHGVTLPIFIPRKKRKIDKNTYTHTLREKTDVSQAAIRPARGSQAKGRPKSERKC